MAKREQPWEQEGRGAGFRDGFPGGKGAVVIEHGPDGVGRLIKPVMAEG